MNRGVKVLLLTFGIFILVLSIIFFIAALSPDFRLDILLQGVVLLVVGCIPIGIVVYLERKESSRPMNITQKINIQGSDLIGGERNILELKCRGCSGSLSDKDVRITDLGMVVKCPYCGKGYVIEEAPKW